MSSALETDRHVDAMTRADLDDVVEIEREAYEFPWTRGNFDDALSNGYRCLGLRHATGRLIGYCVLMSVVDELHLLNLCAAPGAQHSGAALALLREMESYARGAGLGSVLLEVRPSNTRAIAIYERFGFVPIGRRKLYYPSREGREDAIVMRLTFAAEGGHGLD
jgi:[ribosomal protein S18]-alanine N-acetyltransferase